MKRPKSKVFKCHKDLIKIAVSGTKSKYEGLTYPKILDNRLVQWLWSKTMCPSGKHLLDECLSLEDWYLSCDACGLEVHIRNVNKEYCK